MKTKCLIMLLTLVTVLVFTGCDLNGGSDDAGIPPIIPQSPPDSPTIIADFPPETGIGPMEESPGHNICRNHFGNNTDTELLILVTVDYVDPNPLPSWPFYVSIPAKSTRFSSLSQETTKTITVNSIKTGDMTYSSPDFGGLFKIIQYDYAILITDNDSP